MNQMGATNESFRNEMVKSQNTFNGILAQGVNTLTARRQEEPYQLTSEELIEQNAIDVKWLRHDAETPRPVKGSPHYVEDQGDGEVERN